MITIRKPQEIYQAHGVIENGTFKGRWHFSFDEYDDPEYMRFGTLRVFNDDTLSPGAIWPLHPHREIEVVTYCAEGEFRHADEHGKGGVLKKGWVQHTTVGSGMWHSEINSRKDMPMRFIQMWFMPSKPRLKPSLEQKAIDKAERTNQLLALVSNRAKDALAIQSDAEVFSSFLEKGAAVRHSIGPGRGNYIYVLEGGPVLLNQETMPPLAAAKVQEEKQVSLKAESDSEILLVEVAL